MSDTEGDYSGGRWRGRVVNVMDPLKQGRVQVRVFNLHDNTALIPDAELPWAVPRMPLNSGAGIRGVGAAPVGVIPGTIVDGYFGDADRTIFVVTGVLYSAGKTKTGQTVNGSYVIDDAYNSVAHSARGQDLNAALGLKNLPTIAQVGAAFATTSAGIGFLPTHSGDILTLLHTVDPYNMSGSMAYSVTSFIENQILNEVSSLASTFPGGINGIASTLNLIQSGAAVAATTVSQVQAITKGDTSAAISLISNFTGINPWNMLDKGIGIVMNQAYGLASSIGNSFLETLNKSVGNLAIVTQKRKILLQAADPETPPVPETPSVTVSVAPKTPGTSVGADPYQNVSTSVTVPNTITKEADIIIQGMESVPETTSPYNQNENINIMEQLIKQEQSYGFSGA